MAIEHRLGNTGGAGNLLGGGILVTQRDEELLGLLQQLALAISLPHARAALIAVGPGTLRRCHASSSRREMVARNPVSHATVLPPRTHSHDDEDQGINDTAEDYENCGDDATNLAGLRHALTSRIHPASVHLFEIVISHDPGDWSKKPANDQTEYT